MKQSRAKLFKAITKTISMLGFLATTGCGDSNSIGGESNTTPISNTDQFQANYQDGVNCPQEIQNRFRSLVLICDNFYYASEAEVIACSDEGRRFLNNFPAINCFTYVSGIDVDRRPFYDGINDNRIRYRIRDRKIRLISNPDFFY